MDYKNYKTHAVIRLDAGDELISCLTKAAGELGIGLGTVSAIGAIRKANVGLFKTKEKKYVSTLFEGDFEITCLCGNITTMNEKPYLHLHLTAANEKGETFGGHLTEAVVSATCEIFLTKINGKIDRYFSPEIGLNILKL